MKEYRLLVSYPMDWFGRTTDEEVERAVGQDAFASGAGFGRRDLEFGYGTAAERDTAHARLQRARFDFTVNVIADDVDIE